MRTIITFIIGFVVGSTVGGGYMYTQLQGATTKTSMVEASMEVLRKEAAVAKSGLEAALKEAKDKYAQIQASKQSDAEALKTAKEQAAAAQAAKEAAERALAEAKKAAPQ